MSFQPGTPLRSALVAPREAMVRSQQAHIDDLVQRNRALEQDCKRLAEDVHREEVRAKDAARQIRARWEEEREEWREGCDTLLACHRVAHLRTVAALDSERVAAVRQEDEMRKEKIATLQRDYKITMFQVREMELDHRIWELEDELAELKAQNEGDVRSVMEQHENATHKLAQKCVHLSEAHSAALKERDELEEKVSMLREEIAHLRATADSAASKLARTTLQLDGAQTANVELERLNDELKRNDAEIKRQLDKWQNLENKGGVEAETMRKRRVELEVQVKRLEEELGDANTLVEENADALEKEKRRVTKLKEILAEWRQATEEAQEDAEKHKTEVAEAEKRIAKAQKQIAQLKAELETEKARARPSTVKRGKAVSAESNAEGSSENEVEEIIESPRPAVSSTKPRPKPRPAFKVRSEEDKGIGADTSSGRAKDKGTAVDETNDVEFVGTTTKARGRRKVASGGDTDVEVVAKKGNRRKEAKGKREPSQESDSERRKAVNRSGSTQPEPAEDEERGHPGKKKKRKINLFGNAQDTTFAWSQMPQGDNDLGIPTVLSPVKETEPGQEHSTSILGRMSSAIGGFRR